MKMKKIFINLSDYEYPNPFMDYGVRLAKSLNRPAKLIGIEKIPVPVTPTIGAGMNSVLPNPLSMDDVVSWVQPKMENLKLQAKEIWQDVSYDLEVGFPESKLEEITQEQKPYLVVVEGNDDVSTMDEWFGTHETRLAENLDAPVLIVQGDNVWKPLKHILYMMDIEDHAVDNMRIISDIAKVTNADITVAVISGDEDEIVEKNAKYLRMVKTFRQVLGYNKVNYMQIFSENAAGTVGELVAEKGADWLAFEHKDRSFLTRIFDDYNTEHLILHSKIPVLVF